MKSVQINRYGSSEAIEINQNTPSPKLSPGKVLVDIKAAGINPVDWKIREGYMKQMIPLQFPSTLGMDFSGIIKQVGEDVSSEYAQGDEVYGQASITNDGSGAFAEMAFTNIDNIALKPKSLSYTEAAALPLVGVSAWQALVENMELSKGQKILIHGGAGGIGSFSIPLAKNLGAYVATTVSSDDIQFVQDLGVDEAIDYTVQSFEYLLHDYNAVFDTVGSETYTKSFKVLKKGGKIVSMLEQPNSELIERFSVKAIFQLTHVNNDRLARLAQWVDQTNITIHIDKIFRLEEAAKALDYVKDVHPRGKIVLEL
jgi:alcohol dehydrogenase